MIWEQDGVERFIKNVLPPKTKGGPLSDKMLFDAAIDIARSRVGIEDDGSMPLLEALRKKWPNEVEKYIKPRGNP
jgi:hypothetical protein